MKRTVLLAVSLLLLCSNPAAAVDVAHHYEFGGSPRILFVGNSLTFFHSLPHTVATFTKSYVADVVAPGYTLHQHWDDKVAEKEMESDNWDFIILQGKSTEFTAPSEFMEYGRKFGEILRNKHAHVALYETFANDGKPDDQPKIRHIYDELAKELHAQVVPVGDAFYFVHAQAPSIKLWIEDKLHPTAEGTYLAACLFYTYLTKKNPQGLPSQIKGTDPYSVAPKVAKQLQELAWQFYSR